MQGVDAKHPNRTRGKLFRLNTLSAWRSFKRHTVLIEDGELRSHLTRLVESTSALSDPFANDIMYHYACWLKHVNHTTLKLEDAMHLQNVCLSPVGTVGPETIPDLATLGYQDHFCSVFLQLVQSCPH